MGQLAFIVGYDADGIREGTVLGFSGLVEGWEAVGGEDGVEVLARRRESEEGGNVVAGLENMEQEFVG